MTYQQPWEVKAIQHMLPNGELSGKIFCQSRTGLNDWLTVAKALSTLKVHFVFFTGNVLLLVNTRSVVMTGNTSHEDVWTLSLKVNMFIRSLDLAIPSKTGSFEDVFICPFTTASSFYSNSQSHKSGWCLKSHLPSLLLLRFKTCDMLGKTFMWAQNALYSAYEWSTF